MIESIRGLAGRVVERLPEHASLALRPLRYRYDPADVPILPPIDGAGSTLLVGCAHQAGQGHALARSAQRLPGVTAMSAQVLTRHKRFGFESDYSIPATIYQFSAHWRRRFARDVTQRFSHVVIESALPIFGKLYDHDVVREISALQKAGIEVALFAHGSEFRDPARHVVREHWSPYAAGFWEETERLESTARRFREVLAATGVPLLVSTPDLEIEARSAGIPARWSPVVIDPRRWRAEVPPLRHGGPPIVVHAPTRSIVKGSDRVDPIMTELHDAGIVEYRRLEGVPSAAMPEFYRAADIVLDQFRIGSFGVSACEALSAGRIVVGHVSEDVRAAILTATGRTLPIIEANLDDLEHVIVKLIGDSTRALEVAAEGPFYVEAVHDGRLTAQVLRPFLLGNRGD